MKYALCLTLIGVAAGCQSIARRPLDLQGHDAQWRSRQPAEAAPLVSRLIGPADTAPTPAAVPGGPVSPAFDAGDGFSRTECEAVALLFNAQLRVARAEAGVARVSAEQAGLWSDPALQVDVERILDSVAHPWVIGGVLNLTIPLSGRLSAQRALAEEQSAAALVRVLARERAVLVELDTLLTRLAATDRRLASIERYATTASRVADQVSKLRKAGEVSPLEAGLLEAEPVRRQAELIRLRGERQAQLLQAKALMGLHPEADVEMKIEPPAAAFPTTEADRQRLTLEADPSLALSRAEYEVAERLLESELREQYPDLNLGGGYGRDEGTRRVLGGLAVPLPILNANRQGIAEAVARRDVARSEAEAAYERLISELAAVETALRAATEQADAAKNFGTLADQQETSVEQLLAAGQVTPVAAFQALQSAFELRQQLLDSTDALDIARTRIRSLLRQTPTPVREPADSPPVATKANAAGDRLPSAPSPKAPSRPGTAAEVGP